MSELTKNEIAIGAGFFLVLGMLFFRDEIRSSDFYQKTIYPEKWEQRKRARAEFLAKLNELDHRECAILIRAREKMLPIEVERDALFGIAPEISMKRIEQGFRLDQELCTKHGISPYSRLVEKNDDR